MAQMWRYIIFLSRKPTKVTSDFILIYLKKVIGGVNTQKIQKFVDSVPYLANSSQLGDFHLLTI